MSQGNSLSEVRFFEEISIILKQQQVAFYIVQQAINDKDLEKYIVEILNYVNSLNNNNITLNIEDLRKHVNSEKNDVVGETFDFDYDSIQEGGNKNPMYNIVTLVFVGLVVSILYGKLAAEVNTADDSLNHTGIMFSNTVNFSTNVLGLTGTKDTAAAIWNSLKANPLTFKDMTNSRKIISTIVASLAEAVHLVGGNTEKCLTHTKICDKLRPKILLILDGNNLDDNNLDDNNLDDNNSVSGIISKDFKIMNKLLPNTSSFKKILRDRYRERVGNKNIYTSLSFHEIFAETPEEGLLSAFNTIKSVAKASAEQNTVNWLLKFFKAPTEDDYLTFYNSQM